MSPPLRRASSTRDREAEPGAAAVAIAGLVEASEAVEDPFPVAHGDAGAVVGRPRRLAPPSSGGRPARRGTSVPAGVVDQVAHDPLELERGSSAGHRAVDRPRRPPTTSADSVGEPSAARPRGSAGGSGAGRALARVEPGQHEQVLDQGRQPVDARRPRSAKLRVGRAVPSRDVDLDVRSDASGLRSSWATFATKLRSRSRAAASRSSIELRVTASAWISSPDSGSGQPLVLARARDPLGRRSQRLDRPQRRPDHAVGDQAEHQQQQRIGDEQVDHEQVLAAGEVGDRLGHDHDRRAAADGRPVSRSPAGVELIPSREPGTVTGDGPGPGQLARR